MQRKKEIQYSKWIPVKLSVRERDLILDRTLAGPNLTDRLTIALVAKDEIAVNFSLTELDELLGYIAAEANHTESRKLEKELEALYERLTLVEERFIQGKP